MVSGTTAQNRGLLGFIVDILDSYFGSAKTVDVRKMYRVGPSADSAPTAFVKRAISVSPESIGLWI